MKSLLVFVLRTSFSFGTCEGCGGGVSEGLPLGKRPWIVSLTDMLRRLKIGTRCEQAIDRLELAKVGWRGSVKYGEDGGFVIIKHSNSKVVDPLL